MTALWNIAPCILWKITDVSEALTAAIIMAISKQQTFMARLSVLRLDSMPLISTLNALIMEAVNTSKTSVHF
jgi:hypothetical protein